MQSHPIVHLDISAKDPAAASKFYAELCGWKIEVDPQFNYHQFAAEGGPGGEVVATDHFGPYEGLPSAGDALNAWVQAHGREAAGPNWEIYWTDPRAELDSAKWRTEVVKPLRPLGQTP